MNKVRPQSLWVLCICAFLFSVSSFARAETTISNFVMEVRPNLQGGAVITETIVVQTDPSKEFTGITRSLSKRWLMPDQKRIARVDPKVIFLFRNNESAPFKVKEAEDSLTLAFGDKMRALPHGQHQYMLQYTVQRVLQHEERTTKLRYLIPERWVLPVHSVNTMIILPQGTKASSLKVAIEEFEYKSGKTTKKSEAEVRATEGNNFPVSLGSVEIGKTFVVTWTLPGL